MNAREVRILVVGGVVALALGLGGYKLGMRHAAPHPAAEQGTPVTTAQQPAAADAIPGAVQLSSDEEKTIALKTVAATHEELHNEIVTVGKVDEAETRLAAISARVGGRIEKLHVAFTGQPVGRGQAVADIYSPDLLNAAQEYRLALDNKRRLSGAQPDALAQADELISASRKRLELWGVTPAQLEKLAADPASAARVTLYANASGIVTERKVSEGQYVNAGDTLLMVADLSTVWVKLEVYEPDLRFVRTGNSVEMTSDAVPGKLRGRIDFIDTTVNHDTRTASLRVQVANPGMRLRPGMYVRGTIFAAPAMALVVPRTAIIDTGTRTLVYLARGNGIYEAREVKAGQASGNVVPIYDGLSHGDRVVAEGSFLVDAQTRISGGMTAQFGGSKDFNPNGKQGASSPAPSAGDVKVEFAASPDPAKGDAPVTYRVRLMDAKGQPITDAKVRVDILMPAMPSMNMGEMKTGEDLKWSGSEYTAVGNMPMAGSWAVTVAAERNGQTIANYKTRLIAR
jgi:membrane fusion protein, copper/silver efflux system